VGKHPVSDEHIVNCRKKREKESEIIQPDEERRRNLSGIEEKDEKGNHDLEHCACFSQQRWQKGLLTSQFVEYKSA
jgi:hypothetical protein